MKNFWMLLALGLIILIFWRAIVPIFIFAGIVGGALYFIERVLGFTIFPVKTRGG